MANRNQDNQSGRGAGGYRSWEDDDERRYGDYATTDEGDSSVRAGSYDEGRVQFGRRDTNEQSGSTGRYAGYGNFGQGDYSQGRSRYSGQDRYGMTGYGGRGDQGYGQGNYGQGNYGQSDYGYGRAGQGSYGQGDRSNYGSGRAGSDYGYGRSGSSGTGYRGYGYGGSGSEESYGNRGWSEPYGEGQQYGGGSQYGGSAQYGGGSQYGTYGAQSGQFGTGQGQHRGKGPKGYQRSDERLKEMICERLREDPDIDASEVTVNCQGGKITLDGTVDSRRTKNAIEDVAEQFGVEHVQNNLRVQRQGQGLGQGQGSESGNKGSAKTAGADDSEQSKQRKN
jgi:hypothetical protein